MELDPEALAPAERYGLLISVIVPRPIAWVSTRGADGTLNLAPFSFFTGVTSVPMTVCFAPVRHRDGRKKDTLLNVEATREFVVNVATEATASAMVATSADLAYGESEFAAAGLTPAPSARVSPPRVAESPVHLECALHQVVTVSEGAMGGSLVIGRVIHIHVADHLWKDGKISHVDLKPIGRMESEWYTRTTDSFRMPRPRVQARNQGIEEGR